ncbi:MAG: M28 family peptidase [Acidobacteria bacterium]|nr:M28 family peptidase [Acidobacteriota bacterium]
MKKLTVVAALVALSTACAGQAADTAQAAEQQQQQHQLAVADMPTIDQDAILERIRVLSSDEFEGRAPGSRGEELTVKYLLDEFQKLGLKPGNPDGTFIQQVPLVGITGAEAQPFTVSGEGKKRTFKYRDEVVAFSQRVTASVQIQNSELVFVGYGVTAPEYSWDDFKDVDVKGKTIVVLVNDPQVPDPKDPSRLDDSLFNGRAMTYYGRWTYKYEEAARRGAAGVFIVHETKPAGYPFPVVQGFLGERFDLISDDKNMGRAAIQGWFSLETARAIFQMGGQDFDALTKQAITREFRPVPLGLQASMGLRQTMRTLDSQNVVAKLEGSDPKLRDEYVVYTAHWDHLGTGEPVNGDTVFDGALDNASGVASVLEMARALTQIKPQPRRSILFLMVTAEEQGLLGSQHYATRPLYPLEKTVANINVDGVNQWGRTRDLTVIGMGASELDDYLRDAAQEQKRTLRPDPEAEKGFYYRSDHFNFAKVGVPALYIDSGVEYIGKPAEYGQQKRDEYTSRDYHSRSDTIKPDWDLTGAAEDGRLLLAVGYRVANADRFPEWKAGSEFKARRDAMMGGK